MKDGGNGIHRVEVQVEITKTLKCDIEYRTI